MQSTGLGAAGTKDEPTLVTITEGEESHDSGHFGGVQREAIISHGEGKKKKEKKKLWRSNVGLAEKDE